MARAMIVAAVMIGGIAAPALAQEQTQYGAQALLAGRYDIAQTIIDARLAAEPTEPSALLNAAYLYQRTGRPGEALRLYARVLDTENVALDLASGRIVMSHDLANRGLAASQIASR